VLLEALGVLAKPFTMLVKLATELSFRAAPAKLNENNRALRTMDQERRGWRNHREVEAVELSDPERAGLSK
jgi:hypothetical protein